MSKGHKVIFLLTSLIVLSLSSVDIYVPSLPEMTNDFCVTAKLINMTLSFFIAGMAIGTLFAGILSDRYGRKKILLWANGLYIPITLAIAFSNNILLVIILRVLQSLCVSCNIIVTRQVIKDSFNYEEQINATATMLAGVILSPALAPLVGAYLSSWFGWRACFVASGILGMTVFIWLCISLEETNKNILSKLPSLGPFVKGYIGLVISKRLAGYITVNGCAYAAYFTFITISSYVYILEFKVLPTNYSLVYIGLAGAYLVGNFLTKFFVKIKLHPKRAIFIGSWCCVLGSLINFVYFFFPHNIIVAISCFSIGAILARIGIGINNAPLQVMVMNDYSEKSGQALGLLYFFMFIYESLAATLVSMFHNAPAVGLVVVTVLFSFVMIPVWFSAIKARKTPFSFLPDFLRNMK